MAKNVNNGQEQINLNMSDTHNYSITSRTMYDKRILKITYLEQENKNLL
jgi:hypothetical protein